MRRRQATEPFARRIRGFALSAQPLNENTKQTHHPPTNSNQTTYAADPSAQPLNGSTDQQKTPPNRSTGECPKPRPPWDILGHFTPRRPDR
jgi:hypothetical protein